MVMRTMLGCDAGDEKIRARRGSWLARTSAAPSVRMRSVRRVHTERQNAELAGGLRTGQHYSMLAGPHPRSLSRGDYAPRSGRRRCRFGTRARLAC